MTIISENSEEAVVMGRGIAFQKKKGDEIDESKIEKIFVLENKSINEKLLTLVNDIPAKYLEVAENIIKYAENKLGTKLNENIYLIKLTIKWIIKIKLIQTSTDVISSHMNFSSSKILKY